MSYPGKAALRGAIGVPALCAIGLLVNYVALCPIRATGPAVRHATLPASEGGADPDFAVARSPLNCCSI